MALNSSACCTDSSDTEEFSFHLTFRGLDVGCWLWAVSVWSCSMPSLSCDFLFADTAVSVRWVLLLNFSEERLSPLLPSALLLRKSVQGLPVHPKLLPCCTVLVVDTLVKWSVGLWKGKEKGNGKREFGWKTTSHILQKRLMLQKESCLQQMNIKTHKSEINKMLWLQC